MRLLLDFQSTLPKVADEPERNEDAVCIDEGRGVFAVADGASESFDSRAWANLLASRFIEHPVVSREWVNAARQSYDRTWDYNSLGWSEQMAFDRGSFSTLLGCQWQEHLGNLEIVSVGDSVAVHVEAAKVVQSHPYTTAAEFDQRPRLLSTRAEANEFVSAASFNNDSGTVWHLSEGSVVLLMTDALGQWLLSENPAGSRLERLLSVNTDAAFAELVLSERREGALRIDDTSLLVLAVRSRPQAK
ncbi:PP2C family serine/threonine-protein phosphatase [Burkholderia gladioli]|uniref:PP2C family serine/threonine-protein phosphatase n=1 Tax=Burkholderia gladioli TaxID=28095 RepID=UPI00163FCA0D|nr:PP2C family serine/threonine-protein phosphatase [Burkholderia gladioli]